MQKAIHQFWSQFKVGTVAVSAHLNGQSEKATFPCIAYNLSAGAFATETTATALLWISEVKGKSVNEQRMEVFKQISNAIPQGGAKISYDDGYVMLYRNKDFLTVYNTGEIVDGKKLFGGRVSYIMRVYGLSV